MKVFLSFDALDGKTGIREFNNVSKPDEYGFIYVPSEYPVAGLQRIPKWGWHLSRAEAVGVAEKRRLCKIAELQAKIDKLKDVKL
jgi:hypothetical protein